MKLIKQNLQLLTQLFLLLLLENILCSNVNPSNSNHSPVRKLIMSQVLFQNGAHYTNNVNTLIPNELFQQNSILNKGSLTSIGMRQEYELGLKIKNIFKKTHGELTLSDQFNKREIHVQSSNDDFSLQSAQSFLQGFFHTNQKIELPKDFNLDLIIPPLPYTEEEIQEIKTRIQSEDNLAIPNQSFPFVIHSQGDREYFMDSPCQNKPKILAKQLRKLKAPVKAEFKKHQSDLKEISHKLKLDKPLSLKDINKVADIVKSQKYLGNSFQLSSKEYNLIQYLNVYAELKTAYTEDFSNLMASPTFDFIISNFDEKVENKSSLKLVFGSINSSKILALMVALGLLDPEEIKKNFYNYPNISIEEQYPPFSSSFIFQLYQLSRSYYEVEILYNNQKITICEEQLFFCEYQQFKDFLQRQMVSPRKYGNICGVIDDPYQPENLTDLYLGIIIILAVITGVLMISNLCLCVFAGKVKNRQLQKESQEQQEQQEKMEKQEQQEIQEQQAQLQVP